MTADPTRHFRDTYSSARSALLAAAEARGARPVSHPIRARGPGGEELAVDTAYLGPEAPRCLLAVSSGLHGAEGHCGSAIQHQLLCEQWDALALPADTGLLVVHALNPFGFAHTRRVNESNVDLNRNFLEHPEEHVPNPDYDRLYAHINPEQVDDESDREHQEALFGWAREHGFERLQAVLSCGQYTHPQGVQYGGLRAEESNRILREIAAHESRGAARVAWVDIHTGLGPYGEVELISEVEPDHPAYARGKAWYGDRARSTRAGESVSAVLHGVMDGAVEEAMPDAEVTFHAAEFGTFDPIRVFRAMRADNWLHHNGDLESERGRQIKAELLEVFRPADPGWQARVLAVGADVLRSARNGLVGSG